jgi:hypothetical protein
MNPMLPDFSGNGHCRRASLADGAAMQLSELEAACGPSKFRAWIFLTILWIGCVGFIAYTEIHRQLAVIWGYVGDLTLVELGKTPYWKPNFYIVELKDLPPWEDPSEAIVFPDQSRLYLNTGSSGNRVGDFRDHSGR